MFFKKRNHKLDINQGQKDEYFDFDRIESFYKWKINDPNFQNINDHTWHDLDMDEVFMFLDRTHSRIGQQYLYYLLKSAPVSSRSTEIEETISSLDEKRGETLRFAKTLNKLNTRGGYFLINLFSKDTLKKPKWFWVIYVLLICTLISLIGSFIYQPLILLLFGCLIGNFIIHYWNKVKMMEHSNAISQLYYFNKLCKQVPSSVHLIEGFEKARKSLNTLNKKSSLLRDKPSSHNEFSVLGEFIVEVLKASFLFEPLMLYHITAEIRKKKNEIELLFESVGFLDACISINALRMSSECSVPIISKERIFKTTKCYHPLINKPVVNSIAIEDDRSVLISGSNMSGKTTFIRTLGINALLAQTINTVFAKEWTSPKMRIFSAIRISDNLLNDESFYQKEVQVIQEMIIESESPESCLFLIDELYKGTNSIERIGAGVAVLKHLSKGDNIVCASTHDLELTEFLNESFSNYHFTEQVNNETIEFDYKLHKGKLQNTNAIRILEISDYPTTITKEARDIVSILKGNVD